MTRKMNKEERKIFRGLLGKVFKFVGTLEPNEVMLLGRIISGVLSPKIEIEDDD